ARQLNDRIADQLARPVIGHISAAIYPMKFNSAGGEFFRREQYVVGIAGGAERVRVGGFDPQQRIRNFVSAARSGQAIVERPCFQILHCPKRDNLARYEIAHQTTAVGLSSVFSWSRPVCEVRKSSMRVQASAA